MAGLRLDALAGLSGSPRAAGAAWGLAAAALAVVALSLGLRPSTAPRSAASVPVGPRPDAPRPDAVALPPLPSTTAPTAGIAGGLDDTGVLLGLRTTLGLPTGLVEDASGARWRELTLTLGGGAPPAGPSAALTLLRPEVRAVPAGLATLLTRVALEGLRSPATGEAASESIAPYATASSLITFRRTTVVGVPGMLVGVADASELSSVSTLPRRPPAPPLGDVIGGGPADIP